MSPFLAIFLVLVLAAASYAAGRLHGQLSYRIGYRFGYRQGYFDGDRGAWNRRRRDAQAAIASALAASPPSAIRVSGTVARPGTTYTGSSFSAPAAPVTGRHPTGTLVRRTG
ncbi:hypothetical protein [Micromonospora globbae]|jgi:hypothetical protein|uniref:Uncharacterized protein n=1 Tax=Micromonospora globbae TaxID=1894969 RepID=A0A420F5F8_9ACTN|nr:hypothetical protein [Micromonospora globbae]RKF28159.1 hypothetical protein D7I43_07440 [Micromonospora globbae]WTF87142.1 hypothetical protein OH732_06035 [Micromonospora globbae]